MNKPIIIDGVDVSKCNRLNTFPMQYGCEAEICLTHFEQWGGEKEFCKDRPDCYYKQLQRLKAENEELKEELKQLHKRTPEELYTLFGKPIKYWEELQAKNEELKKDKKYRLEEIQNLNHKIKILTLIINNEIEITNKYKQALEEIQNVLFPKNKLLITDSKGLLKTQEILNEVLKDE